MKKTYKNPQNETQSVQPAEKNSRLWGGVKGKIVASCLVVAFVCGVIALALCYALHGDVLLTTDQVAVSSSADNGNNSVSVKLRLEKDGFFLSDIETRKEADKLFVKFYGSVTPSDEYKSDSTGYYLIDLSFDEDIKQIVQEGKDDDEITIITLNHKS